MLGQLGVPGHVAERCMNHRLPAMERVYNTHDYLDERREALDKLAGELSPLVEAK